MKTDPFGNYYLESHELLLPDVEQSPFQIKMNEVNLYANNLCVEAFMTFHEGDEPDRHSGKMEGLRYQAEGLMIKQAVDTLTAEETLLLKDFQILYEYCASVYQYQIEVFQSLRTSPASFDIRSVTTIDWPKWTPLKR